jgi:hypothetical protein
MRWASKSGGKTKAKADKTATTRRRSTLQATPRRSQPVAELQAAAGTNLRSISWVWGGDTDGYFS